MPQHDQDSPAAASARIDLQKKMDALEAACRAVAEEQHQQNSPDPKESPQSLAPAPSTSADDAKLLEQIAKLQAQLAAVRRCVMSESPAAARKVVTVVSPDKNQIRGASSSEFVPVERSDSGDADGGADDSGDDESESETEEDGEELGGFNGAREPNLQRETSEIKVEEIEQFEDAIEEPDDIFDELDVKTRSRWARAMALTRLGDKPSGGARVPKSRGKPSKSRAIELNDPMCDPSTLVYCLFRYRRNRPLVLALLEKLEESAHPETDSYCLYLCYLLLIEPLAAPLEEWLIVRSRTSLHVALQVYWFCQCMIEDHDPRPGPANYKRFLRMQREVQTGVGSSMEERATSLISAEQERPSFDRKGKLRSLEATNRALADAMELRSVFHDVTRFVEQLASIAVTLRNTEPRAERDIALVRELEKLAKALPEQAHLPGRVAGTFQKVLSIPPQEARSFSQRERNPYMLFLEVAERLETDDGLADSESIVSSLHERERQRRSRKQLIKRAMIAPGRVALRAGGKALHGVAYGVGGPTAWVITKSRAGVGATVDGVRERHAKHQQRKEAALAQENDPFAITETPVEKTARMQQVAPPAVGVTGRSVTPDFAPEAGPAASDSWPQRAERIMQQSVMRDVPGWGIAAVLVKADDDLRQQMFCMHLISLFQKAFRREGLDALADGLRPFSIQATSSTSGLVEALPDAVSLAEVKRQTLKTSNSAALEVIYRKRFGGGSSVGAAAAAAAGAVGAPTAAVGAPAGSASWYPACACAPSGSGDGIACAPSGSSDLAGIGDRHVSLEEAKRNCMQSVAAYSLVQYILQLKDRHNGNILLDSTGRLVHIDFSFMLGWAPGGITFEKSAFKLTKDIVDVWGGRGSPLWDEFVELIVGGLQALQMHHALILQDVEVVAACDAKFPCLRQNRVAKKRILHLLRRRFLLSKSAPKLRRYANSIIEEAYDNFWTRTYAKFQASAQTAHAAQWPRARSSEARTGESWSGDRVAPRVWCCLLRTTT